MTVLWQFKPRVSQKMFYIYVRQLGQSKQKRQARSVVEVTAFSFPRRPNCSLKNTYLWKKRNHSLCVRVNVVRGKSQWNRLLYHKSDFPVMQITENCTETTASKVETEPSKINSYLDKIRNGYDYKFTQNFTFLSTTHLFSLSVIQVCMNFNGKWMHI